ncbi:hypothetical protein ScPMuIL_000366 [Solemya velum]
MHTNGGITIWLSSFLLVVEFTSAEYSCPYHHYGENCVNQCNCKDSTCDLDDGECHFGCENGYTGFNCTTPCGKGYYGEDCTEQCEYCLENICDRFSGNCINGCEAGYGGEHCNQLEDDDTGIIAGVVTSVAVIILLISLGLVLIIRYRRKQTKSNGRRVTLETKKITESNEHAGSDIVLCDNPETTLVRTIPNEDYYNLSQTRDVSIDNLKEYTADKKRRGVMKSEFDKLPKGVMFPSLEGEKEENEGKNRYQKIVPYDHTRVILDRSAVSHSSDYINASYIDGLDTRKTYIAAQGPSKVTIGDFWQMVWQEKIDVTVMLTNPVENGKLECEQYWPSDVKDLYGNVLVEIQSVREYNSFMIRSMLISHKQKCDDKRKLVQFHFTAWPDHGIAVPLKIAFFHRHILKYTKKLKTSSPILVHCSTGIGLTGTFIALHALYRYGLQNKRLDIDGYINRMRVNRMNMIQTAHQYSLLHDCLYEAFIYPNSITSNHTFVTEWKSLLSQKTGMSKIQVEFERIEQGKPTYNNEDLISALAPNNKAKNRNPDILPVERWRPRLNEDSDGMGVVALNPMAQQGGFVPAPGTSEEFGHLCVESCSLDADTPIYRSHPCVVSDKSGNKSTLQLFYLKTWQTNQIVPAAVSDLMQLIDSVTRWLQRREQGPIIVQCFDGATCCGLYCALSNAIEQLWIDNEVDLYQIVRELQITRPEFIPHIAQYRLLYAAAGEHIESEAIYANV